MTVFTDKYSKSMTNIDDNEEQERITLPAALLNVQNETLTSETEIKEGELVINQILDEIISNALRMSTRK